MEFGVNFTPPLIIRLGLKSRDISWNNTQGFSFTSDLLFCTYIQFVIKTGIYESITQVNIILDINC